MLLPLLQVAPLTLAHLMDMYSCACHMSSFLCNLRKSKDLHEQLPAIRA